MDRGRDVLRELRPVARLEPAAMATAPCDIANIEAALADQDEVRGYRAAALLRQHMERCGVSRWHPDPVAAGEAAEAG